MSGLVAPPQQVMRALKAIGGVAAMPTPDELAQGEAAVGGPAAFQLDCLRNLADTVQAQMMLATEPANAEALAAGRALVRSWLQELYEHVGPAVDHLERERATCVQRGVSTDFADMFLELARLMHALLADFPVFARTPMGFEAPSSEEVAGRLRALADQLDSKMAT